MTYPSEAAMEQTPGRTTTPMPTDWRLAQWELLVAMASKRGAASFFPNPDRDQDQDKRGIYKMVQWAKTTHGGRQYDLIPETDSASCSSSYGLCE